MEHGHLPRDEKLIDKYYHQKYLARLAFYEQMEKDIPGWKRPSHWTMEQQRTQEQQDKTNEESLEDRDSRLITLYNQHLRDKELALG